MCGKKMVCRLNNTGDWNSQNGPNKSGPRNDHMVSNIAVAAVAIVYE